MNSNPQIISNKTFRTCDSEWYYNAYVGKNGWYNDINMYKSGYREAVESLINKVQSDRSLTDALVYPILFSARHYLELFLKKSIHDFLMMHEITNIKTQEKEPAYIHDLQILWVSLKNLAAINKTLLAFITQLEEFVVDYFDIDLTGETFRYPFDTEHRHHLDQISHINIMIFKERFDNMNEIIDNMENVFKKIYMEYQTGTFISTCNSPSSNIKTISRSEIEEISKKLPQRRNWKKAEFKNTKIKLLAEYKLSSRNFSEVVNKIKKHREFSTNIGITIRVKEIRINDYHSYRDKYKKLVHGIRRGDCVVNLFKMRIQRDYYSKRCCFIQQIVSMLNQDVIAALCAFFDIGYNDLYSENYDELVKKYKQENSCELVTNKLSAGVARIQYIEKGMRKCGQSHLL